MPHKEAIGPWLAKSCMLRDLHVLQKDMVILDVGAHKGNVTRMYQRMWPKAQYYLFEPLPESAANLRVEFAGQPNTEVIEAAVWSETGERTMYVGGQTTEMSSLLPRAGAMRRYYRHLLEEGPTVSTLKLDDFVRDRGIETIHVLKADVQGGELEVLRGAATALRRQKVMLVYLEVFFVPMYDGAPMFWEICAYLQKYGYSLFDIYGPGRSPVNRQLKYADALWVNGTVRANSLDAYPPEWQPKSLEEAMQ